jgi:hypothetical protein
MFKILLIFDSHFLFLIIRPYLFIKIINKMTLAHEKKLKLKQHDLLRYKK